MRVLILGLSIVAIVASTHFAKAGLSTNPREQSASVDTATISEETNQETEDKIGLTRMKRRKIQRELTRLGFETRINGKFDEPTRGAIIRWQEEYGYTKTGFLNAEQNTALLDESVAAAKSDHRGGGRPRRSHGIGGPIGAIGHAVGGLFRR
jgi:peptidoglycan hydrolase-like protein with peptidoglycan-binding domain